MRTSMAPWLGVERDLPPSLRQLWRTGRRVYETRCEQRHPASVAKAMEADRECALRSFSGGWEVAVHLSGCCAQRDVAETVRSRHGLAPFRLDVLAAKSPGATDGGRVDGAES